MNKKLPPLPKLKDIPILLGKLSDATPEAQRSTALGTEIKNLLATQTKEGLLKFPTRGDKVAISRSSFADACILGVLQAGERAFPHLANSLSIVAIGGYGRGRLAPHSDIDLLVLTKKATLRNEKPLLDFLLYALWDSGLTIAQSIRSPNEAIKFAKTDIHGQTAFLDARFLCGNHSLFEDFTEKYEKFRSKTSISFVADKLAERDARHENIQTSRYVLEPDIKEGKGGLRDLDTLHWLDSYVFGHASIEDRVKEGFLTPEDAKTYKRIVRFLWSVRVHIHDLRGRADDRLSFDLQPEIAKRLKYKARGETLAAERLMKHYFLHAKEIGQLTGVMLASLEARGIKKTNISSPARIAIPPDEISNLANVTINKGRLDFKDHAEALKNTIDIFRLFRAFGQLPDIYLHPDAKRTIIRHAGHLQKEVRLDPAISELFVGILTKSTEAELVLREMADLGILGQYLLSFGRIIAQSKYGLFRQYTVDEHVLKSLSVMDDLRDKTQTDKHPRAQAVISNTDNLLPYYLAVLVHETKMGMRRKKPEDVHARVKLAIRRFLTHKEDAEMIGYVIAHKDLMAKTASNRNVLDPKVIAKFAKKIKSQNYLDMLLVVTVCHLREAGLNSWDDWVRHEVGNLYDATSVWLQGGQQGLTTFIEETTAQRKAQAAQKTNIKNSPAVHRLPSSFWIDSEVETAVQLIDLIDALEKSPAPGSAKIRLLENSLVEVVSYSRDRAGLFSDIAGMIAQLGGSVRAASAYPVQGVGGGSDMACNVFVFQPTQGGNLMSTQSNGDAIHKLEQQFTDAVIGRATIEPNLNLRLGDKRKGFTVKSRIRIDLEASHDCTIIEAEGRDRPGLLYQLTKALSEIGVSINRASIATYGERAIDTFYLQDLPAHKITNPRRLEGIENKLLSVLQRR